MLPQGQKEAAATDLWDVKIIKKIPISQNYNELPFLALLIFSQLIIYYCIKNKKEVPSKERGLIWEYFIRHK